MQLQVWDPAEADDGNWVGRASEKSITRMDGQLGKPIHLSPSRPHNKSQGKRNVFLLGFDSIQKLSAELACQA